MTLAIDISHHTRKTSGPLTPQMLDDLWNNDVRTIRPNIGNTVENRNIFMEQIKQIHKHNPKWNVEPYKYYYFGASNKEDISVINWVRDGYFNIQWFGVDIEDVNSAISLPIQQRIDETLKIIKQFERVINTDFYSAHWYVTGYLGNTQQLSFMPLWFADWDGRPDLIIDPPFGGWKKARMKQFRADVNFHGVWCDVNYYEEQAKPAEPPKVEQVGTSNLHVPAQGVFTKVEHDSTGHARKIILDIVG